MAGEAGGQLLGVGDEVEPRPFMPISVANFSMFSKKLLEREAQPGTLMARTVLPRKGAKSVETNRSLMSIISRGLRRSGLSVPYLSMHSA